MRNDFQGVQPGQSCCYQELGSIGQHPLHDTRESVEQRCALAAVHSKPDRYLRTDFSYRENGNGVIRRATVGQVGNIDHELVNVGKAGRKRHMGIRPTVRGSVMNPNDHPHGGGEGRTSIGRPGPSTPWGKPALGLKTRKKNKQSNKLIVRRRDGKALTK